MGTGHMLSMMSRFPVDPHHAALVEARPVILDRLARVERERDLAILFACESGSRAWGFASRDSDFDVRFVYTRPAAEYLRLKPPADAFEVVPKG